MEGWVKRHGVVELRMVKYKIDHCTHHSHPPALPLLYKSSQFVSVPQSSSIFSCLQKFGGWEHGS